MQLPTDRVERGNEYTGQHSIAQMAEAMVTDYFVICTGTSDRQMRAICDEIREYGQRIGLRSIGVAGYDTGQWILVDFVNVVVHIFTPEHREYYDLELLWGDAPRIDWSRSAIA